MVLSAFILVHTTVRHTCTIMNATDYTLISFDLIRWRTANEGGLRTKAGGTKHTKSEMSQAIAAA